MWQTKRETEKEGEWERTMLSIIATSPHYYWSSLFDDIQKVPSEHRCSDARSLLLRILNTFETTTISLYNSGLMVYDWCWIEPVVYGLTADKNESYENDYEIRGHVELMNRPVIIFRKNWVNQLTNADNKNDTISSEVLEIIRS